MAVLRLSLAGLVAACTQCIAAVLATFVVLLAARHALIVLAPPDVGAKPKSELDALVPILRCIYLAMAFGIALTYNRVVYFTAARIRLASRLMLPTAPDHATKSLLTQLTLASVGFAVLALRPPPASLIEAVSPECAWAALVTWSGLMSAVVAGFGANAHAARRAL